MSLDDLLLLVCSCISALQIASCLTICTDLDEPQALVHSLPSGLASFVPYTRIVCCFASTSRSSAVLDRISLFVLCTSRRTRSMADGCLVSCVSANHPRRRHRRDQNLHHSIHARHCHWCLVSALDSRTVPVGRTTLRRVRSSFLLS